MRRRGADAEAAARDGIDCAGAVCARADGERRAGEGDRMIEDDTQSKPEWRISINGDPDFRRWCFEVWKPSLHNGRGYYVNISLWWITIERVY